MLFTFQLSQIINISFFLVVSAVEKCNLHSLNWCSRCEWIHLCELEWEHRWLHIRNSFSLYSKLFFTSRLLHCTVCLEKYSIYHHYVCISLIVSSYSWIWFYAIEIILELNNWENSISSSSSRWMSYCNKFHSPSHAIHAIFEWLWKAIHGEVSEGGRDKMKMSEMQN